MTLCVYGLLMLMRNNCNYSERHVSTSMFHVCISSPENLFSHSLRLSYVDFTHAAIFFFCLKCHQNSNSCFVFIQMSTHFWSHKIVCSFLVDSNSWSDSGKKSNVCANVIFNCLMEKEIHREKTLQCVHLFDEMENKINRNKRKIKMGKLFSRVFFLFFIKHQKRPQKRTWGKTSREMRENKSMKRVPSLSSAEACKQPVCWKSCSHHTGIWDDKTQMKWYLSAHKHIVTLLRR